MGFEESMGGWEGLGDGWTCLCLCCDNSHSQHKGLLGEAQASVVSQAADCLQQTRF